MIVDGGYRCSRCGATKPLTTEHYYFDAKGRVTGFCRPCQAAWQRDRVPSSEERSRRRRYARDWARQRSALLRGEA